MFRISKEVKMPYILFILFLVTSTAGINGQAIQKAGTQDIKAILENPEDKLFVVNFWATWCGPCVKEIPYFEKVAKEYSDNKVEFILMSLDFPSELERRLIPFINKNNISLRVILIEELEYDKWMKFVDSVWQGNLPSTLFFNNAKDLRQFVARPLDEPDLRNIINSMI